MWTWQVKTVVLNDVVDNTTDTHTTRTDTDTDTNSTDTYTNTTDTSDTFTDDDGQNDTFYNQYTKDDLLRSRVV